MNTGGEWIVWSYGFEREDAELFCSLVCEYFKEIVCRVVDTNKDIC
jgi:hypothetical protein